MKKLSELMTMTDDLSSPETKPVVVLFDGVLDAGKLLHCQEIDTFANHFFGKPISAILGTDHNEELHFVIVGSTETDPFAEPAKISNESLVGQGLLGKKIGEVVEIIVPDGTLHYRIDNIVK